MGFVHLHNHTEYSLLIGMSKVKALVARSSQLGMSAVATTDFGVMSSVPELCDECAAYNKKLAKEQAAASADAAASPGDASTSVDAAASPDAASASADGAVSPGDASASTTEPRACAVKPIYGCEIFLHNPLPSMRSNDTGIYNLVLLAKNNEGYHNLMKLSSIGQVDCVNDNACIPFDTLKEYSKGIICLSGASQGNIVGLPPSKGLLPALVQAGQMQAARDVATLLSDCFEPGNFYIEVQCPETAGAPSEYGTPGSSPYSPNANGSSGAGDNAYDSYDAYDDPYADPYTDDPYGDAYADDSYAQGAYGDAYYASENGENGEYSPSEQGTYQGASYGAGAGTATGAGAAAGADASSVASSGAFSGSSSGLLESDQVRLNAALKQLASELNVPLVATNNTYYVTSKDAEAHDLLLCIGDGAKVHDYERKKLPHQQFYLKSEAEMRAAFADMPEACDNTVKIAEQCNVELERDVILPRFKWTEGYTEVQWFRKCVKRGLEKRYGFPVPSDVRKRASYEMGVITHQGFAAYFLIVQEYIQWARSQGICVGPGRGSAAGAIVSYALEITDLDPLQNGLLFERFLSPERVEMPDIDVDFEDERRFEVREHIREMYGAECVSGVITFGKLQAKNAVRDAARALGVDNRVADGIAKLVGESDSLAEDLETKDQLKEKFETDETVNNVLTSAMKIEGYARNEGVHACATMICRDALDNHIPMKRDTKGGGFITQYDGHYTPELGLLKMDFLGLRTLGMLSSACRFIKQTKGVTLVPEKIPIDDAGAFALMQSGNMDGLFQVEGSLYVSLFRRLPPRRFSDIVASIALNRPGPLESGMVDDYVEVASGRVQAHYYDERLRSILEETYGTMVYQEQIMLVSMEMSGFSAGKADRLRKAMGKKKLDIMRQLKEDWNKGAVERGYDIEVAKRIWDDAEKFAKYAFNKSHSAAYAVLVMRTAYMKAHYPFEYMAAVLSSYITNNDKLIHYIISANSNKTPVIPPDVNRSEVMFTPDEHGILYGLAGIKGVGIEAAQAIVDERKARGAFTSLHDFVYRVDTNSYNKKTIEALIYAGAFDSTGYTRMHLQTMLLESDLLAAASSYHAHKRSGQLCFSDLRAGSGAPISPDDIPKSTGIEWPLLQKLKLEKNTLGLYLSQHPTHPYKRIFEKLSPYTMHALAKHRDIQAGTFVGMITNYEFRLTRKGKQMATFALEDATGSMPCVCFDYQGKNDRFIINDAIVKITGKFENGERGPQIIAFKVANIDLIGYHESPQRETRALAPCVDIYVDGAQFSADFLRTLRSTLLRFPGNDIVILYVVGMNGRHYKCTLPLRVDAQNAELQQFIRSVRS